jgi:hypothetical protein
VANSEARTKFPSRGPACVRGDHRRGRLHEGRIAVPKDSFVPVGSGERVDGDRDGDGFHDATSSLRPATPCNPTSIPPGTLIPSDVAASVNAIPNGDPC